MQLAKFARFLRFLLVIGIAGLAVGCGEEGSTAPSVTKEEAIAAKNAQREARKEAKAARKEAVSKGGGVQRPKHQH